MKCQLAYIPRLREFWSVITKLRALVLAAAGWSTILKYFMNLLEYSPPSRGDLGVRIKRNSAAQRFGAGLKESMRESPSLILAARPFLRS